MSSSTSQDYDSGTARRHAVLKPQNHFMALRLGAGGLSPLFKPYVYRGNEPFVPTPKQARRIAAAKAAKQVDSAETMARYLQLYLRGYTVQQAADDLNLSYKTLDQIITRARKRHDPRAKRNPTPRPMRKKFR
jgi:hypothetical protein